MPNPLYNARGSCYSTNVALITTTRLSGLHPHTALSWIPNVIRDKERTNDYSS